MMRCWTLLLIVLLSTLCFGESTWILLSTDCQFRVVEGDTDDALKELKTSNGNCEGVTVAFSDSTMLLARVKSRHVLEVANVPGYFPEKSPMRTSESRPATNWFSVENAFVEVDHSFVLGQNCYYTSDTLAIFIDMNILYIVAECNFRSQYVGAFTRSLIDKDGLVNTPPGPLVYFQYEHYNQFSGLTSYSASDDAWVLRYRVYAGALECTKVPLHRINASAQPQWNNNFQDVDSVKLFFYPNAGDFAMTSRRILSNGDREFHASDASADNFCQPPTPTAIKSPSLVFAAMFTNYGLEGGQSFSSSPRIHHFTLGHKTRDRWTVEYEKQLGNPLSCSDAEVGDALAAESKTNRVFNFLYSLFGIFVGLICLQAAGVAVVLVYYLMNRKVIPKSQQAQKRD